MHIAEALIGERDIKIQVVGIRPGEKIHEILISEEEANHCVARGKYYAILPMLPELRDQKAHEPNALDKEFSSGDVVLELPQTIELLKKHKLMIEDVGMSSDSELLR
jgi:FlaA1/EpsC-like NDP-sugar epimerase